MARVEDLMQKSVHACRGDATMNEAAHIMWERDCGFVPVVASDDSARLVGTITDRDLCMAAYTHGKSLLDLRVDEAMSTNPLTCSPSDTLASAAAAMRAGRVRRLPVVDGGGQLLGVLSLADLSQACAKKRGIATTEISELLQALTEPRPITTA